MNAVDLTKSKDPARVLNNACKPGANPRGTWIIYAQGDYSDSVHNTPVGRAAWALYEQGKVVLCQKRISDEPRRYVYCAVTR